MSTTSPKIQFIDLSSADSIKDVSKIFINSLYDYKDDRFLGGYQKKELKGVIEYTIGQVYNTGVIKKNSISKFNKNDIAYIKKTIQEAILKVKNILPTKNQTSVYVLATNNSFVSEFMDGVTGNTPCRNIFYLYVDVTHPNWKKALFKTCVHEYTHSISGEYYKWFETGTSIVWEGIAENIVDEIVPGKPSPWAVSLDKKEAFKILKSEKENLFNGKECNYDLIYGKEGVYPKWAGYSIGYHLIKEFKKSHSYLSWFDVVKISPKAIVDWFNS